MKKRKPHKTITKTVIPVLNISLYTKKNLEEFMGNCCKIIIADRFYPSSKTCSHCGHKKEHLSWSERTYYGENCGFEMAVAINTAINLSRLATACKSHSKSRLKTTGKRF